MRRYPRFLSCAFLIRPLIALLLAVPLVLSPSGAPPVDAVGNSWATRTDMPTARCGLAVAAASNGKLYAIGRVRSNSGIIVYWNMLHAPCRQSAHPGAVGRRVGPEARELSARGGMLTLSPRRLGSLRCYAHRSGEAQQRYSHDEHQPTPALEPDCHLYLRNDDEGASL